MQLNLVAESSRAIRTLNKRASLDSPAEWRMYAARVAVFKMRGQCAHKEGKMTGIRALAISLLLAAAGPVAAAPFAYTEILNDFGFLDLATGAFTHCGFSNHVVFGLGVGPHGFLYGMDQGNLYRIKPRHGIFEQVAGLQFEMNYFGSYSHQLYAVGPESNLYLVDPVTAAETLVGPVVPPTQGNITDVVSTGATTIFEQTTEGFFHYLPAQGKAHRLSLDHSVELNAIAMVDDVLYAIGYPTRGGGGPQVLYTINTANGALTSVATLSSLFTTITALAPTPSDNPGSCAPHGPSAPDDED